MALVDMRLDGKVALVVGGAKSLGRIECLALAEAGADVSIIDIDIPAARETASQIRKLKKRALVIKADVRSTTQIDMAVAKTVERFGGIDVMVYNAATQLRKKVWEVTDEEWHRVLDITLTGAFISGRAVARQMIKQGRGGKIVNVGSIGSFVAEPDRSVYVSGKAGLGNLTKAFAIDLAPYNIHVNGFCPGVFNAGLVKESGELQPGFLKGLVDRTLFKRQGYPEEVAGITVFLSSAASNYINAENILIDGGMLAH